MSVFDAPYEPSPWEPISEEVARYESSAGTEPSALVGDSWMILWTIGARSGSVRKTPLVRIADGAGRYAVIGSQGGAPTTPTGCTTCGPTPSPASRTVPTSTI